MGCSFSAFSDNKHLSACVGLGFKINEVRTYVKLFLPLCAAVLFSGGPQQVTVRKVMIMQSLFCAYIHKLSVTVSHYTDDCTRGFISADRVVAAVQGDLRVRTMSLGMCVY